MFSFLRGIQPAQGMADLLAHYRAVIPHVKLAGPTSFAPLIHQACHIITENHFAFHILIILGDGELTRPSSTPDHELSQQERATVDAIIMARYASSAHPPTITMPRSHYPLSIVFVGIGDGPWERMQWLDDHLVQLGSLHDNFQFVRFADSDYAGDTQAQRDACFALAALQEIPAQYQAMRKLGLMNSGREVPELPYVVVMEPPEGADDVPVVPPAVLHPVAAAVRPSAPPEVPPEVPAEVPAEVPPEAPQGPSRGPPPPPLAQPPAYLMQGSQAAQPHYPVVSGVQPADDRARTDSSYTPFTHAVPVQPPPIARPPTY